MDVQDVETRFGEEAIRFDDPSGLWFELVAGDRDRASAVDGQRRRRRQRPFAGCTASRCSCARPQPTLELMTGRSRLRGRRRGGEPHARRRRRRRARPLRSTSSRIPSADRAINGLGTVHHVAMAISTDEEQRRLREELLRMGLRVTDIRDRCYFQSIYFREPGGVLFEVATMQPGFTADEELSSLGRELKLPPWEEPYRAAIEASLAPVEYR